MVINMAHAGLDIIKSSDPLYKQEMRHLEAGVLKPKINGQPTAPPTGALPTSDDPLIVLKQLFKPKHFGSKILDTNHIANKYRHKYLAEMKKE
jgi:hypothetical protein